MSFLLLLNIIFYCGYSQIFKVLLLFMNLYGSFFAADFCHISFIVFLKSWGTSLVVKLQFYYGNNLYFLSVFLSSLAIKQPSLYSGTILLLQQLLGQTCSEILQECHVRLIMQLILTPFIINSQKMAELFEGGSSSSLHHTCP